MTCTRHGCEAEATTVVVRPTLDDGEVKEFAFPVCAPCARYLGGK